MLLVLQAVYNYIKAQLVEGRCFHCRNCGLWLQRLFSPLDSASLSISADPSMQLKAHKALVTMEHCSLFGCISWLAFISSPALFLLPSNSLTHTHIHTYTCCVAVSVSYLIMYGLFLDTEHDVCPIFTFYCSVAYPSVNPSPMLHFNYFISLIAFIICSLCVCVCACECV